MLYVVLEYCCFKKNRTKMLPKSNNNRLVSYNLRYDWNSVSIVTDYFLLSVFWTATRLAHSYKFVVLPIDMKIKINKFLKKISRLGVFLMMFSVAERYGGVTLLVLKKWIIHRQKNRWAVYV